MSSAYLERDDVPLTCPFAHQGFQDFRDLVHLDVQTAFARLNFVLRLELGMSVRPGRTGLPASGEGQTRTIFCLGKKKSLTAAAR